MMNPERAFGQDEQDEDVNIMLSCQNLFELQD
jgi:hypothetical protein